jgi:hypothetical protein
MANNNLGFNALGQGSSLQRQASYHGAGMVPATKSPEPPAGACHRRLAELHARHRHPRHRFGAATFPQRDLILFAAFAVTFGTLTIQGLTLRPLMRPVKARSR